jgi:hypothetical protein
MAALGEMVLIFVIQWSQEFLTFQAAWLPISEGFSGYATRFCDPGYILSLLGWFLS